MNKNRSNIGVIILAAGASSRMGIPKQTLKIRDKTLLAISIEAALKSIARHTVVVLGANGNQSRHITSNYPVEAITNPEWETGMGSSIKAGLRYLLEVHPDPDAALFIVCDQPLITSTHINRLITKFQHSQKQIIASRYADTLGVPAVFRKTLFKDILEIENEHGAKQIINRNLAETDSEDFPQGAQDLDTPEDYERFMQSVNFPEDK